ncbi:MAG TPA: TetR/AcrR family transcriptional regulator [Syntrophomonadaceae bacterium]|nr:TetR/AcrR family transcriptional regulator [Syntrophomonadaceae bacterium]
MPKSSRSPEAIEIVRQNILDTTIEIIDQNGYDNFSLRKLAARLGITSTTIYNYYSSKDGIYLAVLTKKFAELYNRLLEGYNSGTNSMDKLKLILHEYIKFGITEANFYNIMFTWDVPKQKDFIGTPLETIASEELNIALESWELLKKAIIESGILANVPKENVDVYLAHIASSVHGIVALYNSKIIEYLIETNVVDPDNAFLNQYVDFLIDYWSNTII